MTQVFRNPQEEATYLAHLAHFHRGARVTEHDTTYAFSEEDFSELARSAHYYAYLPNVSEA